LVRTLAAEALRPYWKKAADPILALPLPVGPYTQRLPPRLTEDDHIVGPNRIKVTSAGNQVVHASEHGQQLGLHRQGVLELADPDLFHTQSPNSQVRVLQRLVLSIGDVLSQPIGPAAIAALPVRVFEAFGTGVTDRNIASKGSHIPIFAPLFKIIKLTADRSARLLRIMIEKCAASVGRSHAAVLRRSERRRLSSANDDEVGGLHARVHERRSKRR